MRLIGVILASLLLFARCAAPLPPRMPFATQPSKQSPITIAVIGDQQRTSEMEVWRERNTIHADLVEQAIEAKPGALILLGDQVFRGSSADDWRFFDWIMRPVKKARIPVYPLFGNHEYLGDDEVAYKNMSARFPVLKSTWYSVVIDSIAFVMLNTNFDEFSRDSAVIELRWFKTRIRQLTANSAVKCIVVCGHHPPFTNSTIVSDEHILQKYFIPIFERSEKSRLWLSGHCHAYEHFRHGNVHYVVSGGGGGPRQILYVDENLRRHDDFYQGGTIRPFHYLLLRRSGTTLGVEMVPLAGRESIGDTFAISRAPLRNDQ